jgi:hypothetical protein
MMPALRRSQDAPTAHVSVQRLCTSLSNMPPRDVKRAGLIAVLGEGAAPWSLENMAEIVPREGVRGLIQMGQETSYHGSMSESIA